MKSLNMQLYCKFLIFLLYMLNNYIIKKQVGAGTFGDVHIAYDKINNKEVALKKMIIHDLKKSTFRMVLNEILIGYFNDCDYLIKILDFFIHKNSIYLVMPFYNQIDYKSYSKKNQSYDKKEFILRILLGIQYLHVNKVIHRDLKIANIMVGDYKSYIGDFGTCNILPENKYFTSTCIGTPFYISPEIIEGDSYNTKVDIYSLGCMLCEIYYNKPPYNGNNIVSLYKNVLESKKCVNINVNTFIGKLINTMIDKKSINRPLINDVIEMYCKNYNLNYKLFRKNDIFYNVIRKDFGTIRTFSDFNLILNKIRNLKKNNNIEVNI